MPANIVIYKYCNALDLYIMQVAAGLFFLLENIA
jgi:hypothetical protein